MDWAPHLPRLMTHVQWVIEVPVGTATAAPPFCAPQGFLGCRSKLVLLCNYKQMLRCQAAVMLAAAGLVNIWCYVLIRVLSFWHLYRNKQGASSTPHTG